MRTPKEKTDLVGNMISEGQLVIMARPSAYKTAGGRLEVVQIVKFTEHGVTVKSLHGDEKSFNTPFRSDKFFVL